MSRLLALTPLLFILLAGCLTTEPGMAGTAQGRRSDPSFPVAGEAPHHWTLDEGLLVLMNHPRTPLPVLGLECGGAGRVRVHAHGLTAGVFETSDHGEELTLLGDGVQATGAATWAPIHGDALYPAASIEVSDADLDRLAQSRRLSVRVGARSLDYPGPSRVLWASFRTGCERR